MQLHLWRARLLQSCKHQKPPQNRTPSHHLDTTNQATNNDSQQLNNDITKHPLYVEGQGWRNAENLSIGDRLRRADGGMARVLAIERVELAEPEVVYNFTVKGPHTYFVLEVGVLVHNAGDYTRKELCI